MLIGYELFFSAVKSDLKNGEDAFVVAVHWTLIHNGYKCIGKGDNDPSEVDGENESELLPSGWNSERGVYSLFYTDSEHRTIYLLKLVSCEDEILVHLMRVKDKLVSDASFKYSDYCTGDVSSFDKAYRKLDELQNRLDKEVVGPVKNFDAPKPDLGQSSQKKQHKKEGCSSTHIPLRVGPHQQAGSSGGWPGSTDPFFIGRGDVDPLAGPSAGGMLMDPMHARRFQPGSDVGALGLPGRLPRGSVPPGARFDPIGPPDLGRGGHRAGPDPDHMRPPSFEDDMFM